MGDGKFTPEQKKATSAKCPILVSAAAGSGKTSVLTERVIKKLTENEYYTPIDKLLIVTFTNAAAAEMRSRIEKRLYEECSKNPGDSKLIKQKQKLGNADICTIDSFCINLVRENFEKCGVDPNFKVTDGTEMADTCAEILTDIINRELSENKELMQKVFEILDCEYDESNLKDLIESLYNYSQQMPFPDRFLDGLEEPFKMKFDRNHPWFVEGKEVAESTIESMTNDLIGMGDSALRLTANIEKADGFVKEIAYFFDDLKEKAQDFSWDGFKDALYEFVIPTIQLRNEDSLAKEVFNGCKNSFKSNLDKLKEFFSSDTNAIEAENEAILPAVSKIVSMVKEYAKRVMEAYSEENMFTFSQTEQMALEILCDIDSDGNISVSEEAKPYLEKYDEVLVDEFQDVNDLQNLLFYILSDNAKKLFVVGDIKQSIYRFRGSNLNNFLDKKKQYIPFEDAKEDQPKKIILANNFRSRKGICEFVNFVFSKLLTENTGEIVYDGEEALVATADYPETESVETEVLLVDASKIKGELCDYEDTESKDDSESAENSLYEIEAAAIADYIIGLIERKEPVRDEDSKKLRPARFDDICILIDKLNGKGTVLSKKLQEAGIPTSFSSEAFVDSPEISLLLSLLAVLDNPSRDVELLTVLMSPLYGFTPNDLAQMRADMSDGNIYAILMNSAENGDEKSKKFFESIKNLRQDMALLPLSKFIHKLIYDTGMLGFVSAMPNGKGRRNNLLSVPSKATDFDMRSAGEFVEYIRGLDDKSFKKDTALAGSVKIMSMHKSKGLQFPICIVSDLSSKINTDDSISRRIYKDRFGFGFKYYKEDGKVTCETLGRKIISRIIFKENIEEKLRLLYVAMTRAKEKLVLVTALKDCEKGLAKISGKIVNGEISPEFVKTNVYPSRNILAACLLHPDGQVLRDLADAPIRSTATDSKIKVTVIDEVKPVNTIQKADSLAADEAIYGKISSNISYVYPFEQLSQIESKTSVSAVAKSGDSKQYYFTDRPQFMNKLGMSSAQKGTAIHNIMQFIEFSENVDVNAEIERLVEWQFITEEQADSADRKKLEAFFESSLYSRILKSGEVKRELRFITELPASRIDSTVDEKYKDTPVIVQGAVDLMFVEDGSVVVVDFKTDRVSSEDELIFRYREQLDIYSGACERIYKKPVKEKIIYSFHLGKIIPLT